MPDVASPLDQGSPPRQLPPTIELPTSQNDIPNRETDIENEVWVEASAERSGDGDSSGAPTMSTSGTQPPRNIDQPSADENVVGTPYADRLRPRLKKINYKN
ncbi:hypothetical protein JYU34_021829 [Plutella xylostella]|uniref:Uncharacterized protein n=1 Tax=Plutella xylostella TaxID=51655 RepID=A0ABQ7PRR7_PLUXY|nr:hypothetical protein JYU34_021829 [Plutella xylostella]